MLKCIFMYFLCVQFMEYKNFLLQVFTTKKRNLEMFPLFEVFEARLHGDCIAETRKKIWKLDSTTMNGDIVSISSFDSVVKRKKYFLLKSPFSYIFKFVILSLKILKNSKLIFLLVYFRKI